MLELSASAKNDIENILLYTIEKWGEQQLYRYETILEKALSEIESNPRIGHKKPELEAEVFCYPAGQHYIFYRIKSEIVYVLRVLHSKMDYAQHLNQSI